MKKLQHTFFCLFLMSMPLVNSMAQQTTPYKTIESFFNAFHTRDSLQLQKHFTADAQLSFTTTDASGQPKRAAITINDFIHRVCNRAKTPIWEERLGKPKIEIHQNLASIWVPYQFYLDGKHSHQGQNFFLLFWNGTHWKILNLSDTRN